MIICKFCGKETETIHHQIRCPVNPGRKGVTPPDFWTEEKRKEQRARSKENNKRYWTEEKRQEHSVKMLSVVSKNPDSYSKNNVSGRVKMFPVESSVGLTQVKGTWELAVANWLNENKIRWTNVVDPFPYFWNDRWRLYFPDFYLPDFNIIIEVKGYKTERDLAKWASVKNYKFVIIQKDKMENLEEFLRGSVTVA